MGDISIMFTTRTSTSKCPESLLSSLLESGYGFAVPVAGSPMRGGGGSNDSIIPALKHKYGQTESSHAEASPMSKAMPSWCGAGGSKSVS